MSIFSPLFLICGTFRKFPLNRRLLHVLGIESSCDDAAVAILNSKTRKVLADRRSADHEGWQRLGGVLPFQSARHVSLTIGLDCSQHRAVLGSLIDAALIDASLRASDVDLVAVSTRPGIILSLKVGIEHALSFARNFRRPLVSVHHMRAHALLARMCHPQLRFPFATLLASGAHCLICTVHGPNEFYIMADSSSGSPGESLDKLARELGILPLEGSFGAALEQWAKKCTSEPATRHSIPWWQFDDGFQMDFDRFKECYLTAIRRRAGKWKHDEQELASWCAGIQHSLTDFICRHLALALSFLASSTPINCRHLVVAGGVASNVFFRSRIREVAESHGFELVVLPAELCTDNGVMVAWTGAEIFEEGKTEETEIYWPNAMPDRMLANSREQIGPYLEEFREEQQQKRERQQQEDRRERRRMKEAQ